MHLTTFIKNNNNIFVYMNQSVHMVTKKTFGHVNTVSTLGDLFIIPQMFVCV